MDTEFIHRWTQIIFTDRHRIYPQIDTDYFHRWIQNLSTDGHRLFSQMHTDISVFILLILSVSICEKHLCLSVDQNAYLRFSSVLSVLICEKHLCICGSKRIPPFLFSFICVICEKHLCESVDKLCVHLWINSVSICGYYSFVNELF